MRAAPQAQPTAAVQTGIDPVQYLTFLLAEEQFAIGILHIKEIIEYHGVTEVPMMPACVRGVTSLRARPKRTARSITGTTRPRRLMMPRMNPGIIGTSVVARYSMISLIETIATPKSSPVTEKVRYCWPFTACLS